MNHVYMDWKPKTSPTPDNDGTGNRLTWHFGWYMT